MVSSSRPLPRSSSGRFTRRAPKARKNTAPAANDSQREAQPDQTRPAAGPGPADQQLQQHHPPDHQHTRKRAAAGDDTPIAQPMATLALTTTPGSSQQRLKLLGPSAGAATANRGSAAPASVSASTSASRKKGATAILRAEQPKPPTKVTVTQPHGGLAQTTNGVKTTLDGRHADDVLGGNNATITPKREGARAATAGGLAVPQGNSATPGSSAQKPDKRSLRSQDGGSRLKSDLAIYFPNYDEVISGVPKKPDFLDIDAPIYIADEPIETPTQPPAASSPSRRRTSVLNPQPTPNGHANASTPFNHTHKTVDLFAIARHIPHHITTDPLDDAVFFKAHRRAERKEKQLRNIEKERAMHEKVQLERLLDGLLGHDWLRVMGISGITDSERREWEPKRDYFVAEVRALVDKFRLWKEEEKRLRVEKELAQQAREEASENEAKDDEDAESEAGDQPPDEDVDAWAARQLHLEASHHSGSHSDRKRATASSATKSSARTKPQPPPPPIFFRPPSPEGPFVSFFAKPHQRAAAVAKRRARLAADPSNTSDPSIPSASSPLPSNPSVAPTAAAAASSSTLLAERTSRIASAASTMAFGQPVPEMEEREFSLPPDYLTEDALRAHARKRRRMMRERRG